jgi:hypothetical protein
MLELIGELCCPPVLVVTYLRYCAGQYGTNIGIPDAQRAALTPDQIELLARGSKCLLAGWTCYVTLIWSLKACMLFFYNRLT